MRATKVQHHLIAFAFGLATLVVSGWALADPPSRVARLGYVSGNASLSPAGEDDWVQAALNRPLVTGDRLWTDADGRTELQLGSASLRMGSATSVTLLNVDDRAAQLQLAQGTLNVRLRNLASGETFEIDTPTLAFTLRKPGEYRIDVDAAGTATTVTVRSGQGDVYGEGNSYVVNARQSYRFTDTALRDFERIDVAAVDDFDRWCGDRDRRVERSASKRYVSPYVVGYEDLDDYGTWRTVSGYGRAWVPTRVAADWAPYRDGHWTWIEPWGWTWVDDAPWGYTVSHYGRWAHVNGAWGWVPGPIAARPVYAPALVAFVGGAGFQLAISSGNVGGVGWFPLGPREVYRPAYAASHGYFTAVNTSNTVVSPAFVDTYYNNPNRAGVAYANRNVPNAVVAVPTTAFVQAQPVARAAVRVPRERIADASVSAVPAVAPTRASLAGERRAAGKPPAAALDRSVFARTAPPPRPAAFERREQLLARNPGHPLDAAATKELNTATAQRDKVKVVAANRAPPTNVPPPRARVETRDKGERPAPAISAAGQPPATAPVPKVAPARTAAERQAMRANAEPQPRGKGEPRNKAGAAPPVVANAPAAAAAPATPAPQHAPRGEARGKAEQRATAPASPPQAANAQPRQKHAESRPAPVANATPAPQQQNAQARQKHAEPRPAPVANATPTPQPQHAQPRQKHAEPRPAPVASATPAPQPQHAQPRQKHAEPRPPKVASVAPPPQPAAAPHGPEAKPDGGKPPAEHGDKKHGK